MEKAISKDEIGDCSADQACDRKSIDNLEVSVDISPPAKLESNPNDLIPAHKCECFRCVCLPCIAACEVCPVLCCCWCRKPRHPEWKQLMGFEAAVAMLRATTNNICRWLCCIRLFTDPPLGIVSPSLPYMPKNVRFSKNVTAPHGGEWFFPISEEAEKDSRLDSKDPLLPQSTQPGCILCPCCCKGSDHSQDPQKLDNFSAIQRFVLYFHGGAFALCTSKSHRGIIMKIVAETGAQVFCPGFRRPPEHPYPAAVDDCVEAYEFLITRNINPKKVVFCGDSAGGGLVLSVLEAAQKKGLPMPAGGVMWSPWVDLSDCLSGTWTSNQSTDYLPRDLAHSFALGYAGAKNTLQEISPCNVALSASFPPLLIECGDAECLCDQVTDLARRAKESGMDIEFNVAPGMVHVFPLFYPFCPSNSEPVRVFTRMANFFDRLLDQEPQSSNNS